MISKIDFVISVVILIIIMWYFGFADGFKEKIISMLPLEGYTSCSDCAERKLPRNGMTVLNPFIWPYSATPCIDSLYNSIDKSTGDFP
jgi:hypothetical protein